MGETSELIVCWKETEACASGEWIEEKEPEKKFRFWKEVKSPIREVVIKWNSMCN